MTLGFAGRRRRGAPGRARVSRRSRSGAAMRRTGPAGGLPVVCVNGGTGHAEPGRLERVDRVARAAPGAPAPGPRLPRGALPGQVVEAARHVHRGRPRRARRGRGSVRRSPVLMLGFSMGGGVSIAVGGPPGRERRWWAWRPGSPSASPWSGMRGTPPRRHPGIPRRHASRASPGSARAARARDTSACARWGSRPSYRLIRGAVHPIALRGPAAAAPRPARPHLGAAGGRRARPASGESGRATGAAAAARRAMRSGVGHLHVPGQARGAPGRGWSTSSRPPAAGPGRGWPSRGRRGGCCASPRRRSAGRSPSCCGSRRRCRTAARPNVWHTELTLHVMWWNRKMRISPPQTMPVRPPCQVGSTA